MTSAENVVHQNLILRNNSTQNLVEGMVMLGTTDHFGLVWQASNKHLT
jgi:hypothetical protein